MDKFIQMWRLQSQNDNSTAHPSEINNNNEASLAIRSIISSERNERRVIECYGCC